MRWLLTFLAGLAFSISAAAQPLMSVVHPRSGEEFVLHSTKGECPSGRAQDGRYWDARVVTYHDPRDGERQSGCYVIDEQGDPHIVIVIFNQGSYAGRPLYIPARMFMPAF